MRRQMFTIILGDRGHHVGKRYFCFRFTYLTKQELSEDSMLDYSTAYLITEIMDSNVVAC